MSRLLRQAVSPSFPIKVTDHEVTQGERMATYDSLCHLRAAHPDCVFSFVIGSDWLQPGTDLRQWESKEGKTGERLLNEFDFIVFPRSGYEVKDIMARTADGQTGGGGSECVRACALAAAVIGSGRTTPAGAASLVWHTVR